MPVRFCSQTLITGRTVGGRSVSPMLSTFFFLLTCSSLLFCSARDTLAPFQSLRGNETLVSDGKNFELGFFSPNGSSSSKPYVGIWFYGLVPRTVVWVANGNNPLSDSSGASFKNDGNLKVLAGNETTLWSTSIASAKAANATLSDKGNLILKEGINDPIWQSFFNYSDTFLPGMNLEGKELTSWKNESDPSPGDFTFMQQGQQFTIRNGSAVYWRSETSNVSWSFDDIPDDILSNFNSTSTNTYNNKITRLVMHPSGQIRYLEWNDETRIWDLLWWEPSDSCSVYKACGAYGSCNSNSVPVCKCLPGFRPISPEAWDSGQFSGGCTREITECGKMDGFLELKKMKVEKTESVSVLEGKNEAECRAECVEKCTTCNAYSFEASKRRGESLSTCWFWYDELKDLQEDYPYGGRDLYVRIAAPSEIGTTRRCGYCGTNPIPYPLSTGSTCGDPAYFGFKCNDSTGQLRFDAPNGNSYAVTGINSEKRTFVIQLEDAGNCGATGSTSKELQISNSFYITNNTILLLNCSTLEPQPHLDCTPSSPCHGYIKEREPCFDSQKCCSYTNGNSLSKLPDLNSGCAYTSIASSDLSSSASGWLGVEIRWEPPSEPMCNSSNNCGDWPNSTCKLNMTVHRDKRCYCNENFRWDPIKVNCTQDVGVITEQSKETSRKYRPLEGLSKEKLDESDQRGKDFTDSNKFREDKTKGIDVPFFDLESVLAATENFSKSNKLGQGGFGPVYKGKLPGGQEIAVKRLSKNSGQGLEEFKNEVLLIAKLQHRNLVRLLGYCIEGDEKMLLYEYMPNKGLDSVLFDQTQCLLLNWEKRFDIILGIARGLLYLHQDSRLKIIHRDLKTSNILLDEEMNPKISDFGMARIFGGKQTEANTNRVVGTYGYMSPEYALDGFFSVKSDVFSFGVVLLEIISGKKNTGYYQTEHALSLLGYTWKLWKEEKVTDLMDQSLCESCNRGEVLKCIIVGLLCVQEDANDRPTMSKVVFMLGSETATLPTPKQPAFVVKRSLSNTASSSTRPETQSNNEITVTVEEGR
ncbi:hypothetical protein HHK36_002023 [Tetracentron sinense]|uniref:Uncharacterized protein n=1 Tax=Tetracentron sinense TaxID=13715 RepID=A0A834ZUP5_TETSI|nr:hypothetical protein HHK36_002023 [Tetracentron sinense]